MLHADTSRISGLLRGCFCSSSRVIMALHKREIWQYPTINQLYIFNKSWFSHFLFAVLFLIWYLSFNSLNHGSINKTPKMPNNSYDWKLNLWVKKGSLINVTLWLRYPCIYNLIYLSGMTCKTLSAFFVRIIESQMFTCHCKDQW